MSGVRKPKATGQLVKLVHSEIEALHADVANYVESNWASDANPDIHLAPFLESDVGLDHLISEVREADGFFTTMPMLRDLTARFPDAFIYDEKQPNGTVVKKLNLPIMVPAYSNGGNVRERGWASERPSDPSSTLGLFLFMSDVLLGTVIYFRLLA